MKQQIILFLLRLLNVRVRTTDIEVIVLRRGDTPVFQCDRIVKAEYLEDIRNAFDEPHKAIVLEGGLKLRCFVRRPWLTEPTMVLTQPVKSAVLADDEEQKQNEHFI